MCYDSVMTTSPVARRAYRASALNMIKSVTTMIPEDFIVSDYDQGVERWITLVCPKCEMRIKNPVSLLGELAQKAEEHIRARHLDES